MATTTTRRRCTELMTLGGVTIRAEVNSSGHVVAAEILNPYAVNVGIIETDGSDWSWSVTCGKKKCSNINEAIQAVVKSAKRIMVWDAMEWPWTLGKAPELTTPREPARQAYTGRVVLPKLTSSARKAIAQAQAAGFTLIWQPARQGHLTLSLDGHELGYSGTVEIGARSGRVLRSRFSYAGETQTDNCPTAVLRTLAFLQP